MRHQSRRERQEEYQKGFHDLSSTTQESTWRRYWHSSSCGLREKGMHSYIAQVAEQGTQMTPVGEVVTTNMGRLSMLAQVNETGVQVDFLHCLLR